VCVTQLFEIAKGFGKKLSTKRHIILLMIFFTHTFRNAPAKILFFLNNQKTVI